MGGPENWELKNGYWLLKTYDQSLNPSFQLLV